MGVNVHWDDPDQTILIYEFTRNWRWEDYYAAGDAEWDLLDEVEHRTDTIIDLRNLDTLPKDAKTHFRNAAAHVHPNRGLIILVGADRLIEAVSSILREIYPRSAHDIVLASTLTRARTLIARQYGGELLPSL